MPNIRIPRSKTQKPMLAIIIDSHSNLAVNAWYTLICKFWRRSFCTHPILDRMVLSKLPNLAAFLPGCSSRNTCNSIFSTQRRTSIANGSNCHWRLSSIDILPSGRVTLLPLHLTDLCSYFWKHKTESNIRNNICNIDYGTNSSSSICIAQDTRITKPHYVRIFL